MAAFLCPGFGSGFQSFTNQGVVNAGGHILTYLAGTTTPQQTWTDSTQAVSNGTSITLDSAGRPGTPSNVEIWIQAGTQLKVQVTDVNNVNVGGTYDFLSGINDSSVQISLWAATSLTPTYISPTTFSVPGNQTAVFPAGIRIRYTLGSGVKYGTVVSSVFGSVTTVTVLPDVTNLDNTLSVVDVSILSPTNSALPSQSFSSIVCTSLTASGLITANGGLTVVGATSLQATTVTTLAASGAVNANAGITVVGTSALQNVTATTVAASGAVSGSTGSFSGVVAIGAGSTQGSFGITSDPGPNLAAITIGGLVAARPMGGLSGTAAIGTAYALTGVNYITTLGFDGVTVTNIQYGTWRALGSTGVTAGLSYGIWQRTA